MPTPTKVTDGNGTNLTLKRGHLDKLWRVLVGVASALAIAFVSWFAVWGRATDRGLLANDLRITALERADLEHKAVDARLAEALTALAKAVPTKDEFIQRNLDQDRRLDEAVKTFEREMDELRRDEWYRSHPEVPAHDPR